MVVSCISSIRFSSLDGLVLHSTSYKGHSTICHRSTNIRKNILFSINHSGYGTREPAGHFCVVFRSNLGPSPQGYINSVVAE
ncbi:hypothetical protein T4E_4616 [Trichinella pseudospiralis]|uniref:Uncharacterized protein n=1 Tax=Trichinella pseudospiralis TaxID=6337 RepID=A0A0V0XRL8_TRIPS|nr:hypothetical protein T4E_4616 [Trichinella pseudospiralis]